MQHFIVRDVHGPVADIRTRACLLYSDADALALARHLTIDRERGDNQNRPTGMRMNMARPFDLLDRLPETAVLEERAGSTLKRSHDDLALKWVEGRMNGIPSNGNAATGSRKTIDLSSDECGVAIHHPSPYFASNSSRSASSARHACNRVALGLPSSVSRQATSALSISEHRAFR